jgi:hypothetical protein
MLRNAKVCALDRLLLERFEGKVGRGLALDLVRRRAFSAWMESLFAPALTGHSGKDESSVLTEHHGAGHPPCKSAEIFGHFGHTEAGETGICRL